MKADDELLFVDNDAIDKGKVFDEADKEAFNILYSRVPTEATTDVKVHAKKMEEYFLTSSSMKMRMLSVIVHDNLDGTPFCRSRRCLGSCQGRLSLCRKANL